MTSSQSPAPASEASTRSAVTRRSSLSPTATLPKIDSVGNGVGFWKTMPTLRRTLATSESNKDAPSSSIVPVVRAPGISSCMRFRQRSSVDLPQPDGPIIAVTWLAG